MIEHHNQEYFNEVKAFAERTGQWDQLKEKLDYLNTYADHERKGLTKCVLYKDFAPMSFEFCMLRKDLETGEYRRWFNGGLIYYSSGEDGVDAPQLSVRIGDTSQSGWSINT